MITHCQYMKELHTGLMDIRPAVKTRIQNPNFSQPCNVFSRKRMRNRGNYNTTVLRYYYTRHRVYTTTGNTALYYLDGLAHETIYTTLNVHRVLDNERKIDFVLHRPATRCCPLCLTLTHKGKVLFLLVRLQHTAPALQPTL